MAKVKLDLSQFKASGVYTLEFDASESIVLTSQIVRLIVGFSRKGPFNAPVYLPDKKTARLVYGDVDDFLERRGSYFHRALMSALEYGPVFGLSLLKLNNDPDFGDKVPYQSFSLATTEPNGRKVYKLLASYYNKERFWFPDQDYLLGNVNSPGSINGGKLFNVVNLGQREVSIIIKKARVLGMDITAKEWYGNLGIDVPSYIHEFDFISDYFIDFTIVQGDWTNYNRLSIDPIYSKYFNKRGLIKSKMLEFFNDESVTVIDSFTGCIIPDLTDGKGMNHSIDTMINNRLASHGVFVAIDRESLENYDPFANTDDFDLYSGVDMVGHNFANENRENPDVINFLSYRTSIKENLVFNIKNQFGSGDIWTYQYNSITHPVSTSSMYKGMDFGYLDNVVTIPMPTGVTEDDPHYEAYMIAKNLLVPGESLILLEGIWANDNHQYGFKDVDGNKWGIVQQIWEEDVPGGKNLKILWSHPDKSDETTIPALSISTLVGDLDDTTSEQDNIMTQLGFDEVGYIEVKEPSSGVKKAYFDKLYDYFTFTGDITNNVVKTIADPGQDALIRHSVTRNPYYYEIAQPGVKTSGHLTGLETTNMYKLVTNNVLSDLIVKATSINSYVEAESGVTLIDIISDRYLGGKVVKIGSTYYSIDTVIEAAPASLPSYLELTDLDAYDDQVHLDEEYIGNYYEDNGSAVQIRYDYTELTTTAEIIEALNDIVAASVTPNLQEYTFVTNVADLDALVTLITGTYTITPYQLYVIDGQFYEIYERENVRSIFIPVNIEDYVTTQFATLGDARNLGKIELIIGSTLEAKHYSFANVDDDAPATFTTATHASGFSYVEVDDLALLADDPQTGYKEIKYLTPQFIISPDLVKFVEADVPSATTPNIFVVYKGTNLYEYYTIGAVQDGDKIYYNANHESSDPASNFYYASFTRDKDDEGCEVLLMQLWDTYIEDKFGYRASGNHGYSITPEMIRLRDENLTSMKDRVALAYDEAWQVGDPYPWSVWSTEARNFITTLPMYVYADELYDPINIIDNSWNGYKTKFQVDVSSAKAIEVGDYIVSKVIDIENNEKWALTKVLTKKKIYNNDVSKFVYEYTVNQSIDIKGAPNSYYVVRYKPIDTFITSYQLFHLDGFKLTDYHLPGGPNKKEQLWKILGMLDPAESNLMEVLKDRQVITFRYIVDTFDGGLEPMTGPKAWLTRLAKERQKCLALMNAPSMKEFTASNDPRFTNEPTRLDPKPVLNTAYIPQGGNLALGPSYTFSLPDEFWGSKFSGYFSPFLIMRERGRNFPVPPAPWVSNLYVQKHLSGNPWAIVAGPRRGVLSDLKLVGLEYDFLLKDRENLEPFGINPIVKKKGVGYMIFANAMAYQKTLSAFNNLHVRDLLITIEETIEDILENFLFEFNDSTTRLQIKTIVETYLDNVRTQGGIYDFVCVMDETNNPPEVIDQNTGIIDVAIEPARGLHKFVSRITVMKSGGIASGGFSVV